MKRIKMICNLHYKLGEVDKRLFGSFAEHMGRVIYSGIYEPENQNSDEDGFRKDVLTAVRKGGITTVRYPGGNFVSSYNWEDGIGPKEKRPTCLDLAWKSIEDNSFGTDEFMRWVRKAKVIPMMAVNLGTRGIMDAVHYLEYCNIEEGTKYSNLRVENGRKSPYNIKLWCLGNEMDGKWQIGHKTAQEYGRLAAETSKAMKEVDPSIETVLCGSSLKTMDTFPEWEMQVLEEAYEYVDYIALHQYFGGQEMGTERFLSQADEIREYIDVVISACKYTKAKNRSRNNLSISFDEWGVWTQQSCETVREAEEKRWQKAPAISEMIYTFEDSLLFAGMLMAFMKRAGSVKIACQALIANISSMIMTEAGGGLWYQPNYYPFAAMSAYGVGTVMDTRTEENDGMLDTVTVLNGRHTEVVIFAVNRSVNEEIELEFCFEGIHPEEVIRHEIMHSEDRKSTNLVVHKLVRPVECNLSFLKGETLVSIIPALSWNVIRIGIRPA